MPSVDLVHPVLHRQLCQLLQMVIVRSRLVLSSSVASGCLGAAGVDQR
mgnify:CR=1 FL=1|jgi:hypothetical protein